MKLCNVYSIEIQMKDGNSTFTSEIAAFPTIYVLEYTDPFIYTYIDVSDCYSNR